MGNRVLAEVCLRVRWTKVGLGILMAGVLVFSATSCMMDCTFLDFVVVLFALDDVLGGDTTLGQIDITLVLVYPEGDDDLVATDADELLVEPAVPAVKLRERRERKRFIAFSWEGRVGAQETTLWSKVQLNEYGEVRVMDR
jgi:hypothetical protein